MTTGVLEPSKEVMQEGKNPIWEVNMKQREENSPDKLRWEEYSRKLKKERRTLNQKEELVSRIKSNIKKIEEVENPYRLSSINQLPLSLRFEDVADPVLRLLNGIRSCPYINREERKKYFGTPLERLGHKLFSDDTRREVDNLKYQMFNRTMTQDTYESILNRTHPVVVELDERIREEQLIQEKNELTQEQKNRVYNYFVDFDKYRGCGMLLKTTAILGFCIAGISRDYSEIPLGFLGNSVLYGTMLGVYFMGEAMSSLSNNKKDLGALVETLTKRPLSYFMKK